MVGALVFGSFSCFWTTLAFFLDSHYGMGAGGGGYVWLVGAAGALVASVAGRMADRHGSRWVVACRHPRAGGPPMRCYGEGSC